ncbi:MAG: DNA gyrase subunit A [Firmicutes bacterium]|nr:DNA gyrase subunit A [Bacillota bacterium]
MAKKNQHEDENFEFENQKIIDVGMEKEVKASFIQYAMSVIKSRALPDVRDGLKPVHRRILYAMNEDKLTYDKPYHKSAATVGNVLGRYHPHGDSSVYDAMVRLAQPFSLRYLLIDGQGNFGNVDGDGAAAYRYTEARLSKLAGEMLSDINKNVVDMAPNFDNKLLEPTVLPSRFPNILVNGSVGIAVGMATNIPPHNMGEVIDGTIYLMEHPEATIPELMQFIKGPDFPTRATIYGYNGIKESYMTGKGRIMVRAKAEIEEDKHRIIVTEIPYMVNKANLVISIADCVKEKRIEGITALRDETGRAGMRIVIEYRHDANGQLILNQLYKYTQLEDTCAVNMLALVNNEPRVLNLKQILEYYIAHQKDVVTRRVRFDLDKALRDEHIFEGYKIAIDNIEAVIKIIRSSESIPDAKAKLCESFGLTDAQAQAIVDMTLGKLSGMEREKVEARLEELRSLIAEYRAVLDDEIKLKEIIKNDLTDIKNRYNDERRTEIVEVENEIMLEDIIERHTCVITLTGDGYVKRLPSDVYQAQKRGGKGIIGMTTKEEDSVEKVAAVNSHSTLLMFTDKGKVYSIKAYQIPESSRTAKGSNIINIIDIQPDEEVTALISAEMFDEADYLTMITRGGTIKRTSLSEFERINRNGKIAISLDEGDELGFVLSTAPEEEIIIASKNGLAVRFPVSQVRPMGRTASGVIGIRLEEGDRVVGVSIVDENKKLLTVTENGYGKQTSFDEFAGHNRGGKGMKCHNITEKTGKLSAVSAVSEDDDVLFITDAGTVIRTHVNGISSVGRVSQGVILMRLSDGAKLVNMTVVKSDGKTEEETDEEFEE